MNGGTVRVGVIGAGDISHYHLGGLQAAGGADIRVICGRRAERVTPVAEQYGIPGVETDYRAVLERYDIDAVLILTPENLHEEIGVAAAQAGKAMMVQKPVAHSIGSCERLMTAADRAGVSLQVSYMHRLLRRGRLRPRPHQVRQVRPHPHRARAERDFGPDLGLVLRSDCSQRWRRLLTGESRHRSDSASLRSHRRRFGSDGVHDA